MLDWRGAELPRWAGPADVLLVGLGRRPPSPAGRAGGAGRPAGPGHRGRRAGRLAGRGCGGPAPVADLGHLAGVPRGRSGGRWPPVAAGPGRARAGTGPGTLLPAVADASTRSPRPRPDVGRVHQPGQGRWRPSSPRSVPLFAGAGAAGIAAAHRVADALQLSAARPRCRASLPDGVGPDGALLVRRRQRADARLLPRPGRATPACRPRLLVIGDDGLDDARRPTGRTQIQLDERAGPAGRRGAGAAWPAAARRGVPDRWCPRRRRWPGSGAPPRPATSPPPTWLWLAARPVRAAARRARSLSEPRRRTHGTAGMSASAAPKAVVAALGANLGIAVIKFVAFALTGSSSMLAEGVHSVVDSGNQGLLLRRRRAVPAARRPPEHPFGYGRDRYVYGFLVALMLFSAGGLFALYEGIEKIRHPHHLDSPVVAVVRAASSPSCLEGFSLRTAIARVPPSSRATDSWVGFIRHAKIPELPVVLLEDVAALIGLVLAFARRRAGRAHRQRGVGRHRHGRRSACCCSSSRSCCHRDQEPAARRGGRAGARRRDRAGAGRATASSGSSTCARCTSGRRSCWSAPSWRCRRRSLAEVAGAIDAAEARVRAAVPAARVIYLEPDLDRRGRADSCWSRSDAGDRRGSVRVPASSNPPSSARCARCRSGAGCESSGGRPVRRDAWGSTTAIPRLLGVRPTGRSPSCGSARTRTPVADRHGPDSTS